MNGSLREELRAVIDESGEFASQVQAKAEWIKGACEAGQPDVARRVAIALSDAAGRRCRQTGKTA